MDKKGFVPVLMVIILVALLLVQMWMGGFFKLSFFQKKDVSMIQYAGSIPEDWDRPDIIKSSVASFDGYEITTEKDSSGCTYSDWYCAPNTCNGQLTGTDENGCPLWTAAGGTRKVWYNCNHDYRTYLCNCNDGDKYLCYDPQYPTYQGWKTKTEALPDVNCGGQTRDQLWCGIGCFARYTIKKDSQMLYDSVDKVKTQDVKVIPIGVTEQATVKTLCRYESTGEHYIPCIYEEGSEAGEYAPISYCEAKYGKVIQCDDVLVDELVTDHLLEYSRGEDLFLDYKLLKVQLNYNSLYDSGDCRRIENTFQYIIPAEAFNFSVIVPQGEVSEGEDISIDIEILNRWQVVKGNLQVYFEVPTVLSTPSTETQSQIIDIPQGESIHSFTIPTNQVTDILKVQPTLYVLIEGSRFEGVNGLCYAQDDGNVRDLNKCEYVEIGTVYDDIHEVSITPSVIEKQTFIEKEVLVPVEKLIYGDQCDSHFDCESPCEGIEGYCRDPDGRGQRCFYEGECEPEIIENTVVETVVVENKTFIEKIIEKIVTEEVEVEVYADQCSSKDECSVPCGGMAVSCVDPDEKGKRCVYFGSCEPEIVEKIITEEVVVTETVTETETIYVPVEKPGSWKRFWGWLTSLF